MQYFESTVDEKKLATAGREMMDYSEHYPNLGRCTDEGLRVLNLLSHVGHKLTTVGVPFGATIKSFSDDEMKLISDFAKKQVDIEQKR